VAPVFSAESLIFAGLNEVEPTTHALDAGPKAGNVCNKNRISVKVCYRVLKLEKLN